jgi:hypothetical protein
MDGYINHLVKYAIHASPIDREEYEEWIEQEFNTELKDVPDDFNLDWIDVLNYVAKQEKLIIGELIIEFPICKKVLFNKFNYLILKHNETTIIEEIVWQDQLGKI